MTQKEYEKIKDSVKKTFEVHNDNSDIEKLIVDLTESEKLCLYGFILGLKENGEDAADKNIVKD